MELFLKMVQLQLQLFMLMIIGIIIHKKGIIDSTSRKALSNLLINVILPCNILNSFMSKIEVTSELIGNCIVAVAISMGIQLCASFGSRFLFRKYPKEKANVMSYGMIVSNSSFIGIPIAESIFGNTAVMYTSVFQIPIRITMWTAGLTLFTEVDRKKAFRTLITHPCVIAVFVGFILMVLQIPFPSFVTGTISSISRCTSAVSMIVIGSVLAEIEWKNVFDSQVLYFSLLRLVAFPLVVLLVLKIVNVADLISGLSVLMTGMPAGATTAVLAEQYGCDSRFAAKLILVSTLLSIITIPLLCFVI